MFGAVHLSVTCPFPGVVVGAFENAAGATTLGLTTALVDVRESPASFLARIWKRYPVPLFKFLNV